jgi:predicted ATPase
MIKNADLSENIRKINSIKKAHLFKNYIDFIQFPFYRNLAINCRINFDFPFTVFIGQNGCGKSSALHALYGAPFGKTPFEFWFDTEVDPIEYYDDERRRHSFWYGYHDELGNYKEVIKARIKRDENPNYWETSRPLDWAGMQVNTEGKRDPPLKKEIVYLDFRSELSAFDKFFYFGDVRNLKVKNKQEFIRIKSIPLKQLLDKKIESFEKNGKLKNKPLYHLNNEELKCISYILGREYIEGKLIEHNLFIHEGYTILFKAKHATYSEAFAGSGEMAVVRLVTEILKAPKFALILLDEPEVSLHPGAQIRLKLFLLNEIKKKKHQIILSSHSPMIIEGLPKEAIKVFYQNPNDGRFLVKEGLSAKEAFFHIEYKEGTKKTIHVEDILAKKIIETVVKDSKPEIENLLNIVYNPGGHSVIKKEFIPVFCRNQNSNDYIVFDGDQKLVHTHINYFDLPQSQLNSEKLRSEIKKQTNVEIQFSTDGGFESRKEEQQLELLKKYLDYYRTNVFYLPFNIPEDIIWDNLRAFHLLSAYNNPEAELAEINFQSVNSKEKFKILTELTFGNIEYLESCYSLFIKNWLSKKDESFNQILSIIERISIG